MKSYIANIEDTNRDWLLVDATDKILGKLAVEIASILRGKTKPEFTPHVDAGDFVVVVNAEKVVLTGNKLEDKMYYRHSGYKGGLKTTSAKKMLAENPKKF